MAFTAEFKQVPFETPRALELDELPGIVADYKRAAENAKAAGFDGVEIHSANGYLLDQFLEDKTNHRTDAYGGSIENRARLLLEVVDAAAGVWGKGRVGVRLSPFGTFSDMGDSDPETHFSYVLEQLSQRGIAYAHLVEPRVGSAGSGDPIDDSKPRTSHIFRKAFKGVLISAGGYTAAAADETVADGYADAVAFGRLFIANPDLPERFRVNAPLNAPDRRTFYGGTETGYTDYPALESVATAQ
jgi:N-ethylmaleimide reductase